MKTTDLTTKNNITITVQELATMLGLDVRTVQIKVKELFPDIVEHGKQTFLNEFQATEVKNNCEKKFAVKSRIDMQRQMQEVMVWLNADISRLEKENKALTTQLDQSKEWFSIKRVARLHDMDWRMFDWRALKNASERMELSPQKIFDANFGEVNVYHVDVWNDVYPEIEL